MAGPRLLLTAFGAFPGAPRNPTATVARRIAARADVAGRAEVFARVLPVTWAAIAALPDLLAELRPDAVLMLGLARRARRIRVERRAQAGVLAAAVDAAGRRGPRRLAAVAAMPLPARAPVEALVRAVRAQGLAAERSDDAGAYLCNAAFRQALEAMGDRPVAFLHLPPDRGLVAASRFGLRDLERAVAATIPPLLAAIRRPRA
jgi:pyroglutamyl-peptidase